MSTWICREWKYMYHMPAEEINLTRHSSSTDLQQKARSYAVLFYVRMWLARWRKNERLEFIHEISRDPTRTWCGRQLAMVTQEKVAGASQKHCVLLLFSSASRAGKLQVWLDVSPAAWTLYFNRSIFPNIFSIFYPNLILLWLTKICRKNENIQDSVMPWNCCL